MSKEARSPAFNVLVGTVAGAVVASCAIWAYEALGSSDDRLAVAAAQAPGGTTRPVATRSYSVASMPYVSSSSESVPASPSETSPSTVNTSTPSATSSPKATPSILKTKGVVVIDPGHSGKNNDVTDPTTGLRDHDYPNTPEIQEMWDVSQQIGAILVANGFTVIYTKDSAMATVSLRDRASIAVKANADIAVSLHDDHSAASSFQAVYAQMLGGKRVTASGVSVVLTNQKVSCLSGLYAQGIVDGRKTSQGVNVSLSTLNFDGRSGVDAGNISMVQLFAGLEGIPWVYNEMGAKDGLTAAQQKAYAQGVANGIVKAMANKEAAKKQCGA